MTLNCAATTRETEIIIYLRETRVPTLTRRQSRSGEISPAPEWSVADLQVFQSRRSCDARQRDASPLHADEDRAADERTDLSHRGGGACEGHTDLRAVAHQSEFAGETINHVVAGNSVSREGDCRKWGASRSWLCLCFLQAQHRCVRHMGTRKCVQHPPIPSRRHRTRDSPLTRRCSVPFSRRNKQAVLLRVWINMTFSWVRARFGPVVIHATAL